LTKTQLRIRYEEYYPLRRGHMVIQDYSGYWTGRFQGTNHGGLSFEIQQDREKVNRNCEIP
jgi:hypothetical protein